MPLNFHQLHIFYTVVDKGSFSAAAQALHMTQPAVTMQVQSLEDYFGTKLLHRSTKRIELTEAGRTLLPYARQSIELLREADAAMSRFTRQLKGRLQLGASLTIGEYILPRLLGPFGKEYPHISIRMKVMNTAQIMEEILNHQLDFGLVEAPVHHPDMHMEPVMSDELKLIAAASHPLAQKREVTLAEAIEYPFVLREQGSGTRLVMEEQLKSRNIDPCSLKIVMELGSTGAVKSAVEAGIGISFVSASSVKHEVALGLIKMIPLVDAVFTREFYSIHLKSALLPISAVTFLTFLRERDLKQWL
ncbi:MAG: LysR family transcriptional regulator [Thermobacillus sp. ZCTH02-B1]|uniref:selenium metabolism-associated LysR family transcriptional regulator n=1 Tax=Thermobacillus sp. ZCTH02-B1 TaxID=1858795 RepID=UPI000B565237|nr:selenium metabolism-associated LysR family transcriptional regulator [Thermobacillus sp. ZCTH02-B1]OUM96447.1 MAG: LysR family transcriptional regulator [Thermobacillus sp. ZCTH02-B1]